MASELKAIVGHEAQIELLQSAVARERLASAYLFTGPSGIGKQKVAIGLAQLLLCETQNGCGICGACVRVCQRSHESVHFITPQSGAIKIEVIRELCQSLSLSNWAKVRLVIIHEAHLMNLQAANALLKELEEPQDNVHFILLTAQPELLPSTIRSRCQNFRFKALTPTEMKRIKDLPEWVTLVAGGQLDRAETLVGEEFASMRALSLKLWNAEVHLDQLQEVIGERESSEKLVFLWLSWLVQARKWAEMQNHWSPSEEKQLLEKLSLNPERIDRLWQLTLELYSDLKSNVDRLLAFENYWVHWRAA